MTTGPESIGGVLGALADPMRRRILDMLAAQGDATATTLAAELPVSRQAVLKHLTVLGRAGLVTRSRQGREVRYLVRRQPLDTTARWLARMAEDWGERLAVLKHLAEEQDPPVDGFHQPGAG